jgi:hypothetical protein
MAVVAVAFASVGVRQLRAGEADGSITIGAAAVFGVALSAHFLLERSRARR